ncbi:MAG TPA: SIMPL domain-containing protein [Clostridiales bacterium]|nr:SIMPL domain-containing protein [Clostridiales bacterium]
MIIQKKALIVLAVVLSLSLGFLSGCLMSGTERAKAAPNEDSSRKTVSAQGEGIVLVTPDIAYINIGVETSDKEMSAAQSDNKKRMNDIMAELSRFGIPAQDIQTVNYNVYPDYQWRNDKNVLAGYKVINTVRVKIRNLDDAGKILDAVAAKGANIVNGIQFTVEDTSKFYEEALRIAVKNAEDKAKVMTGYFGIKELTPVSITERPQGYYPIVYDNEKLRADTAESTPINAGRLEIRASVDVSFEY